MKKPINKQLNIIYWMALILFVVAMIATGIQDLMQTEDFISKTKPLGYPLYFYTLLGVFEIGGGILLISNEIIPNWFSICRIYF